MGKKGTKMMENGGRKWGSQWVTEASLSLQSKLALIYLIFLSFITKVASLQCAPYFQQGQHLIKLSGSPGKGQGFVPESKVGFPSWTPDQRNWKEFWDVGSNSQAPPQSYSALHMPFSNLPGLLLKGDTNTEQVVSIKPVFRRHMGLLG